MPDLINHYTHKIDPDIVVEHITRRTSAWVQEWSVQLGEIMKLSTHEGIDKILTASLQQGQSVAEFTQAILDSGIRDEYYRARMTAVTEMLTAHSVAQQESFEQSPAVERKMWRHTGAYKNEPRFNHAAIDGQVVPVNQPFELEGEDGGLYNPDYPRDTNLPPGERINCHCLSQPVVSEDVLGLSLEERQKLQEEAIAADDGAWERELDARNRARAGIDETIYKPDEMRYNERQEAIHADILANYNLDVNTAKQNRHIEGSDGFKDGRSVLTAKPEKLINKYAGKSQAIVSKDVFVGRERFNHTSTIGTWVSRDGTVSAPTSNGIIHYSKNGAHIVPAKPHNFDRKSTESEGS